MATFQTKLKQNEPIAKRVPKLTGLTQQQGIKAHHITVRQVIRKLTIVNLKVNIPKGYLRNQQLERKAH
jgi:hypothetical protein